jgi:carboxylesterase
MPLGLNTILRYYYSFPEREPYGIKNEDTRKKISKLMSRNTVALDYYPMSCVYELLKLSKYTRKYMKKVKTPLLLIHAERDDLTSPKSANFVYKTASSEIKELIILHDSYHLVVYDNEKDFVFNKSVEFLNSLSQEELTLSEAVS